MHRDESGRNRGSGPARGPSLGLTAVAFAATLFFLSCDTGKGDYVTGKTDSSSGDWQLVWSDEFDGNSVDATKWVAEIGNNNGWGNSEQEYYTGDSGNLDIVEDGGNSVLRIRALADSSHSGYSYTSARIKTQSKFSFQYGKIEAKIKLPQGQGLWPAFWMLGDSISTLGWPRCGEIDILEMKGGISDDTISSTLHWPDAYGNDTYKSASYSLASGVFADGYHIFAMQWDSGDIYFFLDGTLYSTQPIKDDSYTDMSAFTAGKFFVVLNLAVGGNFLGGATPPSGFDHADMYVDYVRVYQKQS